MVDRFDPNQLRSDLLWRMANAEAPQRNQDQPGVWSKIAEELLEWFRRTAIGRRTLRNAQPSEPFSAGTGGEPSSAGVPASAPAATPTTVSAGATESASAAGVPEEMPEEERGRRKNPFPSKEIAGHLSNALRQLLRDVKMLLFLAFPRGSVYHDQIVEDHFQWHYTRRGWLCLDWSTVALGLMLVWDVLMNPPYRMGLILLFYAACAGALLLRKVLLVAAPSTPKSRRIWHNVLLCLFFFGRCVVCQPLFAVLATEGFAAIAAEDSKPFRALQVEAFTSVMGLGMTNLSMVFMQQLQTLDMLLFCLVNGAVFILWIIFVLRMPLTDALHTAYVGSIVVTTVCVRQQHDLEDLERRTFEHDVLQARGVLVRTADRLVAQCSAEEYAVAMRLLGRVRRSEHLNL